MTEYLNENQELSLSAALFAAFLCTLFGGNAVAIKVSLFGLGPFTAAGIRFTVASLAILLWAFVTRQPFRIQKGQLLPILILSASFVVQLSAFHLGLSKTQVSHGSLIMNLQPFFVLVFAHYFISDDKITKRKVWGIVMGFAGVAFVFLEQGNIGSDLRTGDFIIFIAVFIWAASTIYIKKIIRKFQPFHLVLYPMIFSVPFFFLEGFLWDEVMIFRIDENILLAVLYNSIVTAAFGFVAWNRMLQKYGAVSMHTFVFIMPVTGVLLGGLLLGEPVTPGILLALLLVVSGILVVHLNPGKFFFPNSAAGNLKN
ncbi:MAG: multidrug DMT transporter permease [Desulfobacteraceae bacterium IS3]|nr:MAG: multidrug DMT transporter permease [Desulfobacteraceae bacterium IS3]